MMGQVQPTLSNDDDDVDRVLRETFGLAEFRPGQRAIIDAVLAGRPTVAVMPTGAGKSLCYQLPAVVAGGTALVISPLISLMKDQADSMLALGIAAATLTSALSPEEQSQRLDDLAAGKLRIVYVAPERFKSSRFVQSLAAITGKISLFAIDEAHCISQWGHDFRPDYMRLGDIVTELAPPRLVALTATATPEVRADIVKRLNMVDPLVAVHGFDRPNLRFSVEHVRGKREKNGRLFELVSSQKSGSVIVYASTRKNTEAYSELLQQGGLRAGAYHAGLDERRRTQVQDDFMAGQLDVVVATNAFGMGIDKSNVRLVLHADLPRSAEAYYQEAGRAGRDGEPAEVALLFQHSDVKLQEFLIDVSCPTADLLRSIWKLIRDDASLVARPEAMRACLPDGTHKAQMEAGIRHLVRAGYLWDTGNGLEARKPTGDGAAAIDPEALDQRVKLEHDKLRLMVRYAYSPTCRRQYLLTYFGDDDGGGFSNCGGCDVCDGVGRRAVTPVEGEQVRTCLALVGQLDNRYGRGRLAKLLCGKEGDNNTSQLAEHGALRSESARYVMDLLGALEGAGLLQSSRGEYPTLSISEMGSRVRDGEETVELAIVAPSSRSGSSSRRSKPPIDTNLPPADEALVERLRSFRGEIAARTKLPAYCVFSNRTLMAIAQIQPENLAALADVPGIGPAKLSQYGGAILAVLAGAAGSTLSS